jgi:hypothetical protein
MSEDEASNLLRSVRANTARAVVALALAETDLNEAREDDTSSSERVMRKALVYRESEQILRDAVNKEAEAVQQVVAAGYAMLLQEYH